MPRTISLVLVIPAERVAHSLRGFIAVVTVDVDGLGRGICHHQTPERDIDLRNHLKWYTIQVQNITDMCNVLMCLLFSFKLHLLT